MSDSCFPLECCSGHGPLIPLAPSIEMRPRRRQCSITVIVVIVIVKELANIQSKDTNSTLKIRHGPMAYLVLFILTLNFPVGPSFRRCRPNLWPHCRLLQHSAAVVHSVAHPIGANSGSMSSYFLDEEVVASQHRHHTMHSENAVFLPLAPAASRSRTGVSDPRAQSVHSRGPKK